MLEKARSVVLAAQEAVVVATERLKLLGLLFLSGFLFQACSVELATTTPGAQAIVCAPSTAQLTAFSPIMTTILQQTGNVGTQQGCANCHIQGVGTAPNSGTGAGSFRILNGTTADIILANFCSSYSRKDVIAVHPTQASHAQVYSTSDLAQLAAWVATF